MGHRLFKEPLRLSGRTFFNPGPDKQDPPTEAACHGMSPFHETLRWRALLVRAANFLAPLVPGQQTRSLQW
jgi:hypothetical protein